MNDRALSLHLESRVITRSIARNLKKRQIGHSLNLTMDMKYINTEVICCEEYVHKKFDKLKKRTRESSIERETSELSIERSPFKKILVSNKRSRKESFVSSVSSEDFHTEVSLTPFIKTEKMVPDNEEFSEYKDHEVYHKFSAASPSRINIKTNPKLTPIVLSLPAHKLSEICRYNPNMARKFPPKERTPKELERRIKNTEACRISRRKRKLEDLARDRVIEDKTKKHFGNLRNIMYNLLYIQLIQRSILEVMHQFDKVPTANSKCAE